jgi:hypothetical protein
MWDSQAVVKQTLALFKGHSLEGTLGFPLFRQWMNFREGVGNKGFAFVGAENYSDSPNKRVGHWALDYEQIATFSWAKAWVSLL